MIWHAPSQLGQVRQMIWHAHHAHNSGESFLKISPQSRYLKIISLFHLVNSHIRHYITIWEVRTECFEETLVRIKMQTNVGFKSKESQNRFLKLDTHLQEQTKEIDFTSLFW